MALAKSVVMQKKAGVIATSTRDRDERKEQLLGLEIKEAQRVINALHFQKPPCFKLLIGALNASKGSISCIEDVLITSRHSSTTYAIKTCY